MCSQLIIFNVTSSWPDIHEIIIEWCDYLRQRINFIAFRLETDQEHMYPLWHWADCGQKSVFAKWRFYCSLLLVNLDKRAWLRQYCRRPHRCVLHTWIFSKQKTLKTARDLPWDEARSGVNAYFETEKATPRGSVHWFEGKIKNL